MQQAGNADLAAALAPGQQRRFQVLFMVDWARDGLYADVNSDLSDCFESAEIDRQLTGNYPSELDVTEGYAAAQMAVTLAGSAPDDTPLWQLFSPYSAPRPATLAGVDIACRLDVVVDTATGPVPIRQFTGVIRYPSITRAGGAVTLLVRDALATLSVPVSWDCWAVDEMRTILAGADLPDSMTITLSSLMDFILRKNGAYEGPAFHNDAVVAWTLCGSALPEIGSIAMEDYWINGPWTTGYGVFNIPQWTPAGPPADVFEAGRYGSAFRGSAMPAYPGGRTVTYLLGNAHATTTANPLAFIGVGSNLLGCSFWVKIDPTLTGTSLVRFYVEDARDDGTTLNYNSAYIQVEVDHDDGAIRMLFIEHGHAEQWLLAGDIGAGWHFVDCVWAFTAASITLQCTADGVAVPMAPSGPQGVWPPEPSVFGWPTNSSNLANVSASGPLQYVQVYWQPSTLLANWTPAQADPINPTVQLDLSTLRLLWRPKTRHQPALPLLQSLVAADMGVLYVTEAGVITYDNRETVRLRQTSTAVDLVLDLDRVKDLEPSIRLESVVNVVRYVLKLKHTNSGRVSGLRGENGTVIYAAETADQYEVANGATVTRPVAAGDDVQSVRMGPIKIRYLAMGYDVGPGTPNPNWRDWMETYKPNNRTWSGGYTPYGPGTRGSPAAQPVPREPATVSVLIGYSAGDFDPAHLRLVLNNASGGTVWYAVDDTTPFLHVPGALIVTDLDIESAYTDTTSAALYGERGGVSLAGDDWIQDSLTVPTLIGSLILDTRVPRPVFQDLETPGDPRVQLQDVVRINDPGQGGPGFGSIVGIRRSISRESGIRDRYTLRSFGAVGAAWVMDDPLYSIMDVSTIVG